MKHRHTITLESSDSSSKLWILLLLVAVFLLAIGFFNPGPPDPRYQQAHTPIDSHELPTEVHSVLEHPDTILPIAFSPNSKWLVSGCNDLMIRLWSLKTGEVLQVYEGHEEPIQSLAFSPNQKWLASGSEDNTVKLWHLKSGRLVLPFTNIYDNLFQ